MYVSNFQVCEIKLFEIFSCIQCQGNSVAHNLVKHARSIINLIVWIEDVLQQFQNLVPFHLNKSS